jgi:hypothetical protein
LFLSCKKYNDYKKDNLKRNIQHKQPSAAIAGGTSRLVTFLGGEGGGEGRGDIGEYISPDDIIMRRCISLLLVRKNSHSINTSMLDLKD